MINLSFACTRSESARLEERLTSCLPAATFEMETLCRLAGIEASREVPTAAVECRGLPRMLINPDFVEEFCRRDEHLFLLVMHELWHVLLGHTRLYPRLTFADNIAFDAIINASLARQFQGPLYRGFFEELNPADRFPGLLLRPPAGWPARPGYPEVGPRGTTRVLRRLYPPSGTDEGPVLYEEVLQLLRNMPWNCLGSIGDSTLIGDHSSSHAHEAVAANPLFGELVRRIVASWPPPPFQLKGRDAGGNMQDWASVIGSPSRSTRAVFARVLRRCLGPRPGHCTRRTRRQVEAMTGPGVLPNAADRLAPARRQLGGSNLLWQQRGTVAARVPETPSAAHVYLDVSGSMGHLLPRLLGLLAPYVAAGQAQVFEFSTVVAPTQLRRLMRGKFSTTGGTNINCVYEHLLASPRVRRALVLTDGYTGTPRSDLARAARERGLAVHVVLPDESAWFRDLESHARSITVLPPLGGQPKGA